MLRSSRPARTKEWFCVKNRWQLGCGDQGALETSTPRAPPTSRFRTDLSAPAQHSALQREKPQSADVPRNTDRLCWRFRPARFRVTSSLDFLPDQLNPRRKDMLYACSMNGARSSACPSEFQAIKYMSGSAQ